LRKKGTELYFGNEGSAAQVGSINCTDNAWRGSIVAAINPAFLYDQLFAIGGALRHCHFDVEPGRINSAEHPMAVSNTSPCLALNTIAVANNCIGRMLAAGGDAKARVIVSSPLSTFAVDAYSGVSQWGEPFGTNPQDQFLGGLGAFSFKDGIDNGGTPWGPKGTAPNIEHNEQSWPILYLWRKTLTDSAGAGLYRGGSVSSAAAIPHRVDAIRHDITAWGSAVPTSTGLFGGEPSIPNRIECMRGSNVRTLFEAGRIPGGVENLEGSMEMLGQRVEGAMQTKDDVWITTWCGGAGYGDPLEREASAVLDDVRAGLVSSENARRAYGVVFTSFDCKLEVDESATESERAGRRRAPGAGAVRDGAT
jgi:N-methylhydantoinase B